MQYRDNEVRFDLGPSGGFSLVSGAYVVQSFSVTNGQDPEGKIHTGLIVTCGSDGSMTFQVGRKGSSDVANWFNGKVPAASTTFNHTAGDLNFAFLGQLTLTITGGALGGGQATLVFENVAIAQGHSGASNNWWFGGPTCSYIGSDSVKTAATWNAGRLTAPQISFNRGGNAVNVIAATGIQLVDTSGWMGLVDGTKAINAIVMPGSHDAGMSTLSHCAPPIFSEPYTQTQAFGVGQQLEAGSRYLDVRVDYDYDQLVTYHRTNSWGCNGQDLKNLLDQVQAFLQANVSETVILKISHIRDYEGHQPADTKARINTLLASYSSMMYSSVNTAIDIAVTPISQLRGKAVIVFDYDEFIDPTQGKFRYRDQASGGAANLVVYDQYSDTDNYNVMSSDQITKWQNNGDFGKDYLFLLSWTLTASPPGQTLKSLAGIANSHLPAVLFDQIKTVGKTPPNIVYLDFVDAGVCQSAIIYNVV